MTTRHAAARAPLGTYGLRLIGLDEAARLLAPCNSTWPSLRVVRDPVAAHPRSTRYLGDASAAAVAAEFRLDTGGTVTIDDTGRAVFRPDHNARARSDEHLVHPFLFGAAAVTNRWLGRQTFHAAAFCLGDRAWAVSGHRTAGKTSTVAMLERRGATIMTDDLLVVDDGDVLSGPSCLDLRPDAAAFLGIGRDEGLVGARNRWRHVTTKSPVRAPLAGWIYPTWGDEIAIEVVPPAERIELLFAGQAVGRTPPSPEALIALAALPTIRFTRPRAWTQAETAVDELLAAVGGLTPAAATR